MRLNDVLGLLAGIVVLGGLGAYFLWSPEGTRVEYVPTEVTGSQVTEIQVADDGRSVLIDANIEQAGFLTINAALGEAPGPALASSELLEPGEYDGVQVEVEPSLDASGEYFVLMFVDDGDGVYEPRIDLPVMSDGQVIKEPFSL